MESNAFRKIKLSETPLRITEPFNSLGIPDPNNRKHLLARSIPRYNLYRSFGNAQRLRKKRTQRLVRLSIDRRRLQPNRQRFSVHPRYLRFRGSGRDMNPNPAPV